MKKLVTHVLILLLALFSSITISAQSPVDYLSAVGNAEKTLASKYLSYMSAASHGRNIKKIERRRAELIRSIDEVRSKINDMPSYNGDKSLRDSAVNYVKILYKVFNEDYANLVNMEEIAEQSYDLMEAYMMAQDKAGEKLKEAAAADERSHRAFAKNNNIQLIEANNEMDQKLEQAGKVQDYYNNIYLIFFKAHKQEYFYMEALKAKNTNAMEQNRSALLDYASQGLDKLKDLKGFDSDKSLENACRKTLEFYKGEATKDFVTLSEFLLKTENFEKAKTAFESSAKTKAEADEYNKEVAVINKASDAYNKTNEQLNNKRNELVSNYEETINNFMDTHMPYAN